ncbi:MAG: hypothetical protein ACI87W_000939 [Halieaceae bacterium]|jgi:hypothetical protein
MTYHFLCNQHRQWLSQQPLKARAVWTTGMETAQGLIIHGSWSKALPHAGCAFETAQLMVANVNAVDKSWLRRHAASKELLQMIVHSIQLWGPMLPAVASPNTVH